MMVGKLSIEKNFFSVLRTRTLKKRTVIFGLKSDHYSREILLQLLTVIAKPGDNVLAVHVEEQNDTLDLNTFHIHEDLCKSKKVDFLVKVCIGDSYITELSNQVRISYATILALGCSLSGLKDSEVLTRCLRALPPACTILVMDNLGRILVQRQGTSQQGSTNVLLKSSLSSSSKYPAFGQPATTRQLQKSLTAPSSSTSSTTRQESDVGVCIAQETVQVPESIKRKIFEKLAVLEAEGSSRRFTSQELCHLTHNFSPKMLIGQGGNSKVYRTNHVDGQVAAVKVLKCTNWSEEEVLREVELLSSIKHENIVRIIGYCHSKEMYAIVYNLLNGSLKQYLKQLKWNERMDVAIGVAKALEYLHHTCDPPIIHRDVKSSNILLSENFHHPQLSDFGAAMVHHQSHQVSENVKPVNVVGTFGYLAPEYMMYGKVDEKIDVYSYGVVLLELITGKEAIQTNKANRESLVLWARSLLSSGLCERLIDPQLNEEYNREEIEIVMCAARLCLLHSSSRRPTMKTLLKLFQEPDYWLKMKREKEELLNERRSNGPAETL
ncbi:protein kinase domain-containing protein [Citrus sinensis]|uniref:Protein kinase domain-containing protein n=1 Tax=Citrus sinensis TaxID=2711 RepID=A0ACB8IDM0_CITSI|nr:protein kinase domain-containing protein [Citrus sinensis]